MNEPLEVPVDATQWHVHKELATKGPERLRDCSWCLALNAAAENAGREIERLNYEVGLFSDRAQNLQSRLSEAEEELSRKESQRVYIWEKGELLASREYLLSLQNKLERAEGVVEAARAIFRQQIGQLDLEELRFAIRRYENA